MQRIVIPIFLVGILAFCGAGCSKTEADQRAKGNSEGNAGNEIRNICDTFNADFAYTATGKAIAHLDRGPLDDEDYCQYFTDYSSDFYKIGDGKTSPGGPWFSIKQEFMDAEKQKKSNELIGYKVTQDPRIPMDNFTVFQKDDALNAIYLVMEPNRFIVLRRSSKTVISEDEMVNLSTAVAKRLNGEDLELNPNPIKAKTTSEPTETNDQAALARSFFEKLGNADIDGALGMMDANQATKDMWRANFKTLKSLKIKNLEPTFKDEWTSQRQTFKAELEANVTAEGETFGWQNGQNFRWISLKKSGDKWVIHEIANNP